MTIEKRLTRKQKRELQQQVKKTHQLEKKARLLARPDFQFSPRIQRDIPDDRGNPRIGVDPGSIMDCLMEWSSSEADIIGAWSWGQPRKWDEDDWDNLIYPNLCEFQKLKWSEIYAQRTVGKKNKIHKKHHEMHVCDIDKEACERWNELGLDEYETMFRFRLGNKPRLWGYRIYIKYFLIWWDKFHKICPNEV